MIFAGHHADELLENEFIAFVIWFVVFRIELLDNCNAFALALLSSKKRRLTAKIYDQKTDLY